MGLTLHRFVGLMDLFLQRPGAEEVEESKQAALQEESRDGKFPARQYHRWAFRQHTCKNLRWAANDQRNGTTMEAMMRCWPLYVVTNSCQVWFANLEETKGINVFVTIGDSSLIDSSFCPDDTVKRIWFHTKGRRPWDAFAPMLAELPVRPNWTKNECWREKTNTRKIRPGSKSRQRDKEPSGS